MSKGLGQVQRKIELLFTDNPDRSFSVEELCREVYGQLIVDKRHRTAVIRAAKRVIKTRPEMVKKHGQSRGRRLIFFNHRSLSSYASAHLKVHWPRVRTEAQAQWELCHDRDHRELIKPGGACWQRVQDWIAKQDGESPGILPSPKGVQVTLNC